MNLIFVDTCFWIALMSPQDALHLQAVSLSKKYNELITSQEILAEFMNFFCGKGSNLRYAAIQLTKKIQNNESITLVEQTAKSFNKGMNFYAERIDKEYSLIDCISMVTMREKKINRILTKDHHFSQEGFEILM